MKSAFVLSDAADFPEGLRRSLVADGALQSASGTVQLIVDGVMLNADFDLREGFRADIEDPPEAVHGDGPLPTPRLEKTAYVECRSEELFIWCVQQAAKRMGQPLWVLDTNGVLWRSDLLDPTTLWL